MQKEELIEKCTGIFTSYGAKVSMDEISRMLEISKRTLYEFFDSKENLIYECVLFTISKIKSVLEVHFSENGNNVIEKLFPMSNQKLQKLLVEENRFLKDVHRLYWDIHRQTIQKHTESVKMHLVDIIKEGMQDGLFLSDIYPEIIIDVVFTMQSALTEKFDLFEKYSHTDLFKNTVLCYLRGISTPKGIEMIEQTLTIKN